MRKLVIALAAAIAVAACTTPKDGDYELTVFTTAGVGGNWLGDTARPRASLLTAAQVVRGFGGDPLVLDLGGFEGFTPECAMGGDLAQRLVSYMGYDAMADGYKGVQTIPSDGFAVLRKGGLRIAVVGVDDPGVVEAASSCGAQVVLVSEGRRLRAMAGDTVCVLTPPKVSPALVSRSDVSLTVKGGNVTSASVQNVRTPRPGDLVDSVSASTFARDFEAAAEFASLRIGLLTETLHSRDAYLRQSAYMSLYHHLALGYDGAVVSLMAPLAIDGTISEGILSFSRLRELYPFPNRIVTLDMTGRQIREFLESSYDGWICPEGLKVKTSVVGGVEKVNFASSPGNFDSAGGLGYTVDITAPRGSRVAIRSFMDGRPFRDDAVYRVATTSYRAAGAGGHFAAAGLLPYPAGAPVPVSDSLSPVPYTEGPLMRELLYRAILSEDAITPSAYNTGSWTFLPSPAPVAEGLVTVLGR